MSDDADERWLDCFVREGAALDIRPASPRRDWMDATPGQHAYRCLPLVHANSHGWEIRAAQGMLVRWSGGPHQADLSVTPLGPAAPGPASATSAFGSGILTFRIPALFRTPPGVNLWVMGPPNRFKDAVQPLSGIIETDWLTEHGFTMNWKVTRPGADILFAAGEPIAFVCPIPRGFAESFTPRLRRFPDDPQVAAEYAAGQQARQAFQQGLQITDQGDVIAPGPEQGARWQGRYYRGIRADGQPAAGHQTRLRLRPFEEE